MAATRRVALVTGGTRGIGEAIARRLAADGFEVFVSGRTEESARKAAARFAKDGLSIRCVSADAKSEADQKRLVETVHREAGRLDVLVNNAGIGSFDAVDRLPPESFREVIETNLFGPYYAIHHAAPLMKKGGGGFIVNIASLAGVNAFAGGAAYNASKFGLLGLSDAAMLDLRHDGIRITTLRSGHVASGGAFLQGAAPEQLERFFAAATAGGYMHDVGVAIPPQATAKALIDVLTLPREAHVDFLSVRAP